MATPSGEPLKDVKQVLGRIRAWFLIKTKNGISAEQAAEMIFNQWIYPEGKVRKDPDLVVIRADVVIPDNNFIDFDLIVPVDAASTTALGDFKTNHLSKLGQVLMARAIKHFPDAPYLSNGYITSEEGQLGSRIDWPDGWDKKNQQPGLTRRSPGDNPWG